MTMKESMMKNQASVYTPMNSKNYHIYLNDKCLFKNLERELFEIIWDRLYVSYHKDDLTYTEVDGEHADNITEHSY